MIRKPKRKVRTSRFGSGIVDGGGPSADYTAQLAKMGSVWEESKSEQVGDVIIPDGEYVFRLVAMGLRKTGKGLKLLAEFTILTGDHRGVKKSCWQGFEPEQLVWTQALLRVLGADIENMGPEDIPGVCKDLVSEQITVRGRLKTTESNGVNYQNLTVIGLVDVDPSDLEEEEEEDSDDSDTSEVDASDGDDGLIVKGDVIAFIHKGKDCTGTVESVNEDAKTLRVLQPGKQRCTVIGLDQVLSEDSETESDSDDESEDLADDTRVEFVGRSGGKTTTLAGKVVDCADGVATIKVDGKRKLIELAVTQLEVMRSDDDDSDSDSEDESEDTDSEIVVGDLVSFLLNKKEIKGRVVSGPNAKEQVCVKYDKNKRRWVHLENVTLLVDEN